MDFLKSNNDKEKKPSIIGEKTLVPISMVIILLGFGSWLTHIAFSASANETNIKTIGSTMIQTDSAIAKELKEINTRLSRIEGKLDNGLQGGRR